MPHPILTLEQASKLFDQLGPHLVYLGRLRDRMDRRGFPPNDPMRRTVANAYDAVHALRMQAHYASVPSGVGPAAPVDTPPLARE